MAAEKSLRDLFVHAIKDIYYAENAILKALPKMIDGARHEGVKQALTNHLEETRGHVERLAQIFGQLEMKPVSVRCEAIEGILREGEEILEEFGGTAAGDAGIIFAAQAVEHYEINRYGSMHTWAQELNLGTVATLLKKTLDEEYNADATLTHLAKSGENEEAITSA